MTTLSNNTSKSIQDTALVIKQCAHGAVRSIYCGDVSIGLFHSSELEASLGQLYLRRYDEAGQKITSTHALTGAKSHSLIESSTTGKLLISGMVDDVAYVLELVTSATAAAWFWHIKLYNQSQASVKLDVVYTQDVGLNTAQSISLNEAYIAQYLDFQPLEHPQCGLWLAIRQNNPVNKKFPWLAVGSLGRGVGYATDALQIIGMDYRANVPLKALMQTHIEQRHQHEHSLAVIVDEAFTLAPNETTQKGFFAQFVADHPVASSTADNEIVDNVLYLPETNWQPAVSIQALPWASNKFINAPILDAQKFSNDELKALFCGDWQHIEYDGNELFSFFIKHRHIVLKAKELNVLRPHGHMMRTGQHWTPDESSLTTTVWMAGIFNSLVTQGHVNFNHFLSTQRGYLSLFRSRGQRIFVNFGTGYELLDEPSCFEISQNQCVWYYKHAQGVIKISTTAALDTAAISVQMTVLNGAAAQFFISNHIILNDADCGDIEPFLPIEFTQNGNHIMLKPHAQSKMASRFPDGGWTIEVCDAQLVAHIGTDEMLFDDGASHDEPFLCIETQVVAEFSLTMTAQLIAANDKVIVDKSVHFLQAGISHIELADESIANDSPRIKQLFTLLPWLSQNALVHYLAPRGLEQFSGGGWGVRDVSQGPTELLLALGRFDSLRDLLIRLFSAQDKTGDWPQWFMVFNRDADIRAPDSHGDIVFWPMVSLAQYISATGDKAILEAVIPFYNAPNSSAELATLHEHIARAFNVMRERTIKGTHLAAYGHGDWNDALQPADPALRGHMSSAWTVTLHYRMLKLMAAAWRSIGLNSEALVFEAEAEHIKIDFQNILIADGVVAGYALFDPMDASNTQYLLHPRDTITQLQYSVLPIIHAMIDNLFTPEQVQHHLNIIEQYLLGPDGVRLFDKPLQYHGGTMKIFQRGESASYFGREVGVMYTHAHLRYAEALAHIGHPDAFFYALCQINPIGLRDIVANVTYRQANCYSSSSDAAFLDRYDAFENYGKIKAGTVALECGWRVYSSGAGIAIRLMIQHLLGLEQTHNALNIDPVLPKSLSGLSIYIELFGKPFTVNYVVQSKGFGVQSVTLNGQKLTGCELHNPYRQGALSVARINLNAHLKDLDNQLVIVIS